MQVDTSKKTFGFHWTPEEDSVLFEMCSACAGESKELHDGYLKPILAAFPHRTRAAIRHRIRKLVDDGKAPLSWLRPTVPPVPKWSELETGWLAGIFDGEGSISVWSESKTLKRFTFVLCTNTDRAIIDRVMGLVGPCSATYIRRQDRPQHKPCCQVIVKQQEGARTIILRLMPHISSSHKLKKMAEALAYIDRRKA